MPLRITENPNRSTGQLSGEQPVTNKQLEVSQKETNILEAMSPETLAALKSQAEGSLTEVVSVLKSMPGENLKEAEKLWEQIRNWKPDTQKSLSENLEELHAIYQTLKDLILETTTGNTTSQLLMDLEQALNTALEKLYQHYADSITDLFTSNNQQDSTETVKQSIQKEVAEPKETLQEAAVQKQSDALPHSFAAKQRSANISTQDLARFSARTQDTPSPSDFTEDLQGILYQKDVKGAVQINKDYSAALGYRTPTAQTGEAPLQAGKNAALQNSSVPLDPAQNAAPPGKLFSMQDIEKGNQFADYITEQMQDSQKNAPYKSDELLGLEMALLALKTQVFTDQAALSPSMSDALNAAIDQYIRHFVSQTADAVKSLPLSPQAEASAPPLDKEAVFAVFQYIMKEYQQTGNLHTAVTKGLEYALAQYEDKLLQHTAAYLYRYREDSPFWEHSTVSYKKKKPSTREEYLELIKLNWNDFLQSLVQSFDIRLLFDIAARDGLLARFFAPQGDNAAKKTPQGALLYWGLGTALMLFLYAMARAFSKNHNGTAVLYLVGCILCTAFIVLKAIANRDS